MIGLETQYTNSKSSGPDLWLAAAGALMVGLFALVIPSLESNDQSVQADNRPGFFLGQTPPGTTPVRFAPDLIALDGAIHGSIAFYPDGSEIYWTLYSSDTPDDPPMIMFVRMTEGVWSEPSIAPFCDEHGAGEISITPSGDRLYFSSRRPLPAEWGQRLQPGTREWGVGKVWYVDRVGAGWSEPFILDERINNDLNGVSASNQGTLYGSGIRRIELTANGWGDVVWLGAPLDITRPGGQFKGGHPYIAPDESFILFNDRWSGHNGYGIFVSFRDDTDRWSPPVNILESLGIDRGGSVPVLSPEGKYLFYFASGSFWWVDASVIDSLRGD